MTTLSLFSCREARQTDRRLTSCEDSSQTVADKQDSERESVQDSWHL